MSTNQYHDLETVGSIHIPNDLEYADQATRKADTSLEARHVGRLALQADDGSMWRLVDTTPTWATFTPPAAVLGDIGKSLLVATDGGSGVKLSWAVPTPAAHASSHEVGGSDLLSHQNIAGAGSNTHAQIDSHIGASAAHGVSSAIVGTTDGQTLSNKTLTTPTIASFVNATHNHADAAGGGTVSYNNLTDVPSTFTPSAHASTHASGGTDILSHSALAGLTGDDHSQYALLAGRAGGQTLYGGNAASNNLTLISTSNATKGEIRFATPEARIIDSSGSPVMEFVDDGSAGGAFGQFRVYYLAHEDAGDQVVFWSTKQGSSQLVRIDVTPSGNTFSAEGTTGLETIIKSPAVGLVATDYIYGQRIELTGDTDDASGATITGLDIKNTNAVGSATRYGIKMDDANFAYSVYTKSPVGIIDTDIVLSASTGTKIGTATTQKLGFWNKTPVAQLAKASYNNWAALSDVVQALVDVGLFDQA